MTTCALALVLLMDVSGSVDPTEYALQRDGTADAFRSAEIGRVVERSGPVAVTAIEWGSSAHTTVRWTVLDSAADARRFADTLAATTRSESGMTYMGHALEAAGDALAMTPCEAEREVVDVSGDGRSNDDIAPARMRLEARGAVINALVVPDTADLPDWFRAHVVTPGGFAIEAEGYGDFGRAILRKLVMELAAR